MIGLVLILACGQDGGAKGESGTAERVEWGTMESPTNDQGRAWLDVGRRAKIYTAECCGPDFCSPTEDLSIDNAGTFEVSCYPGATARVSWLEL